MFSAVIKCVVIASCVVLIACGITLAQDEQSIPVSCTIPAVPGLNVPLLEDTAEEAQPAQEDEYKLKVNEQQSEDSPEVIEQEYNTYLAKNEASPRRKVETIYLR